MKASTFPHLPRYTEAANANDTETVRYLINKGADVNAKNAIGDTPLLLAASYGNVEVVKLLLAKGADVNVVDAAETIRVKNSRWNESPRN